MLAVSVNSHQLVKMNIQCQCHFPVLFSANNDNINLCTLDIIYLTSETGSKAHNLQFALWTHFNKEVYSTMTIVNLAWLNVSPQNASFILSPEIVISIKHCCWPSSVQSEICGLMSPADRSFTLGLNATVDCSTHNHGALAQPIPRGGCFHKKIHTQFPLAPISPLLAQVFHYSNIYFPILISSWELQPWNTDPY